MRRWMRLLQIISMADSTSLPWSQMGSSRKFGSQDPVLQERSFYSLSFLTDRIILIKEHAMPREKGAE